MKIKFCPDFHYTLKSICPECNQETKEAGYKFVKIKSETHKFQRR